MVSQGPRLEESLLATKRFKRTENHHAEAILVYQFHPEV